MPKINERVFKEVSFMKFGRPSLHNSEDGLDNALSQGRPKAFDSI